MNLKQNTLLTLLSYLLILEIPTIFQSLGLPNQFLTPVTTINYLAGAGFLLWLQSKGQEVPFVEKKAHVKLGLVRYVFFILLGVVVAFMAQYLSVFVEYLYTKQINPSTNTGGIVALAKQHPIFIIAVAFAGPIMEELVFRRAIIGTLTLYMNEWLAALLSSLLFALMHQDGHLLTYGLLGLVFYYFYQKTGKISVSIGIHCSMNALVILALV